MSKSQSKEFFKKKQRGQNKKNSTASGITISTMPQNKVYHIQTSHGSSTGLLGNGEDPAVVVINPHPSTTTHHNKEKRTKICCLL
jgi:hypothetical protein